MIPAELVGVNFKELIFNFRIEDLQERKNIVDDMRLVKFTIKRKLENKRNYTYYERSMYDMKLKIKSISICRSENLLNNLYIVKFEDEKKKIYVQSFNYGDYICLQNNDIEVETDRCLHSIH